MIVPLGDTYEVLFTTRQFSTGAPFLLAGTPVLSVYEEANTTQITAGVSVNENYDSITGLNQAIVVATTGNGYEVGKYYSVVITTGTVDSVPVVGEVVGHFRVGPAEDAGAGIMDVNLTHVADAAVSTGAAQIGVNTVAAGGVAWAAGAITAGSIAADAITAAKIAADAIGASELAADAVTEIQSGLATGAALSTAQADLDTITGTDGVTLATAQALYAPAKATDIVSAGAITTSGGAVSTVTTTTTNSDMRGTDSAYTGTPPTAAAIADAVLDEALAEPAGVFSWSGSLRTIIPWLGALARNKQTQTATTKTLRNDADGADLATATVSDDATTATHGEWT